MKEGALGLFQGSRVPADPGEMDLLLRRVPEVALLADLEGVRLPVLPRAGHGPRRHAARIVELCDETYLSRLEATLGRLALRAELEENGGLLFLAKSLLHFTRSLPPDRHPLIVALYFASPSEPEAEPPSPELLARLMDEYETERGG